MDETVITNPGDIILIRMGKPATSGFYAKIIDVTADHKRGWWQVRFNPLVMTSDFKLIELMWKLDNDQIRGQEFTMNQVPHQLFKVEFPDNGDSYPDDPVPLPTSVKKKPTLTLIKR